MSAIFSFGYPALPTAIVSWGARAIFRNGSVDILPDRQQFSEADSHLIQTLAEDINSLVIPAIRRAAQHLAWDSTERFSINVDWPRNAEYNADRVLVAQGSPNASYGYLYIAVSLVARADAPAEIRPDVVAAQRRAEYDAQRREAELRQAEYAKLNRVRSREIRRAATAKREAVLSKGNGNRPAPGTLLNLGDQLVIHANQADREAVVIAVNGLSALIEYVMPNGRAFKWEVERETHRYIRNISKLPLRFIKAL